MSVPTIWSKDPHTNAKHRILEEYLKAWFPILSQSYPRIIFIDGFAGPGVYEEGEMGSPIIALDCLMNHSLKPCERKTEFVFLFIEADSERAGILKGIIEKKYPHLPANVKIHIEHGEFEPTLGSLLDSLESKQKNLAPTFAFIDPFGYGGLPLYLVKRILAFAHCEVFINFAYDSINRFIEAKDTREEIFDKLFGTSEWRSIREIKDSGKRNQELTALYTKQLKTSSKYVRSFEMINDFNKVSYYLYFATNQIKGFEEMKRAMWKVDPRGSFRFADTTDVGVKFLLSFGEETKYSDQADNIFSRFKGQIVNHEQIKNYCIEHTAFPTFWSSSLKILENKGKISVITPRKRKGTFPPGCRISFKND
jgi:three-Cys-motif partner protein